MKQIIKEFCKRHNISVDQFTGKSEIAGYLDLRSLTSIPEGFNPTVGGSLYLPNKFRGTVQTKKPEPGFRENLRRNKLLFWKDGKYVKADGIFTEVLSKKGNVYKIKKVHSVKEFYLITDGKLHAHGDTIEKAKEDFRFKVMSEKLKKEPITPDTIITIQHYRIITGACELGVKQWMESNDIKVDKIKASELLPLLEKTGAYGVDKFRSLVSF